MSMTSEDSRNSKDNRVCSECGSNETPLRQNKRIRTDGTLGPPYPQWYSDGMGGYHCKPCRARLVDHPKWNLVNLKIHNERRLTYKGKVVRLKEAPRIGVCNWCRAVPPFDCAKTQIHHEQYDDENPLAHTIEVCPKCHIATKNFDTEKNRAALEYRRKNLIISERNEKGQIIKNKYKTKEREG
jgi:hypothetical protein